VLLKRNHVILCRQTSHYRTDKTQSAVTKHGSPLTGSDDEPQPAPAATTEADTITDGPRKDGSPGSEAAPGTAAAEDGERLRARLWDEQDMSGIRKGPLAKLPIEALRRHLQVDALGGVIVREAEDEALCRCAAYCQRAVLFVWRQKCAASCGRGGCNAGCQAASYP
jgi:hypothetical protein